MGTTPEEQPGMSTTPPPVEPGYENGHTGEHIIPHAVTRKKKSTMKGHWKRAAEVVGAIIGIGTVVGVLGRAFYVQREEYTQKLLRDGEDHARIQAALTRSAEVQEQQGAAIHKAAEQVESIKGTVNQIRVDISAFGRARRREQP